MGATIVIWTKRPEINDAGCTRAYNAWWEAHWPVQLNRPRVLEEDELAHSIDEIIKVRRIELERGRQ